MVGSSAARRSALVAASIRFGVVACVQAACTQAACAQTAAPEWPGPYAVSSSSFAVGVSAPISGAASPGGSIAASFSIEGGRPLSGLGAGLSFMYRWHAVDQDSVQALPGASIDLSWLAASPGAVSLRPTTGLGLAFVADSAAPRPALELSAGLNAALRVAGRRYLQFAAGARWLPAVDGGLSIVVAAGPRSDRAWPGRVAAPYVEVSGVPTLYSPDGDGVDDRFSLRVKAGPRAHAVRWAVAVLDPAGAQFMYRGGDGPCPAAVTWDGVSDFGAQVDPATDYSIRVEVEDVLGRKAAYESAFTVDILVERVGDKYRVRIPPILFPSDSADLGAAGAEWMVEANARVLTRLVELFGRFPEYGILIEGHANSVAWSDPAAFAREQETELKPLSLARAEAVRAALVRMGVDPRRIAAAGLGAAEPIAAFGDLSAAWRNRRVEIILSKRR